PVLLVYSTMLILVNKYVKNNMDMKNKSFDFNAFYTQYTKYYPKNKLPSQDFLEWFMGFFEGDGSMIMGKSANYTIMVQSYKDKKVLQYIQNNFNMGTIAMHSSKDKTTSWSVKNTKHMYLLCLLFNGNLVLPIRLLTFIGFISKINIKLFKNNEDIIKMNLNVITPTLNDHWIAGFTDAEGCFSASVYSKIDRSWTFNVTYVTSQKYESNKYVLEHMLNLFNLANNKPVNETLPLSGVESNKSLGKVSPHSKPNVWDLRITGYKNCNKMLFYFDTYSLKSNKLKSYSMFKEVLLSVEKGEHTNPDKRTKTKELCKTMNKSNMKVLK
ncbi:hypothetical protein CajifM_p09, partial (mitochondrion) [Candida jiufengensis]